MKFRGSATITHEVDFEIEAANAGEMRDMLDTADCCVESCDGDIIFTTCCQSQVTIDSEECVNENIWDNMSKLERANVLKENGLSDDASFDIAQSESLTDIDEELWDHFDEA